MSASVLVVEDDNTLRKNICTFLVRQGYTVDSAANGTEGIEKLESACPDIALIDLFLPDTDGIELMSRVRAIEPQIPIVIMTGTGSVQAAVDAMKAGASDYLSKPLVLKELALLLAKLLRSQQQASMLSYFIEREADQSGIEKILGESPAIQGIKRRIRQFLAAERHLDDQAPPSVLITGETGCGKELVARAFHFDGARREQPFVEINCASIPAHLLEAELFGYERGAFTDAKQRKIGLVDAANGGTLFLDEIGEMAHDLQAKLLTLLENRRVRRLGSVQEHDVNVRIIAATNQDLELRVEEGTFRSDLYYRLRVIQVDVPPLRDRGDDVRLLAERFLRLHAERYRHPGLSIGEDAMQRLLHYHWPGNVRELRNTLEQAVLLCAGSESVRAEHVLVTGRCPPSFAPVEAILSRGDSLNLQVMEVRHVREALARTGGNLTRAAALLGLSRDTLRYRLSKYGITTDGQPAAVTGR